MGPGESPAVLQELGSTIEGKGVEGSRPVKVPAYLGMLDAGEGELGSAFASVAKRHELDAGVRDQASAFARSSNDRRFLLRAVRERYHSGDGNMGQVRRALFGGGSKDALGLLRDIQGLAALATHVRWAWIAVEQAAKALPDESLASLCEDCGREIDGELAWLATQMRHHAPQTLVVPE